MMMMKICGLTFEHLDGDSGDVVVNSQTIRCRLDDLPERPRTQNSTWQREGGQTKPQ